MPQPPLPPLGAEVPELPPVGGEVPQAAAPMNFAVVNGQRVPVDEPNTVGTAASHYFSGINPVQAGQMLPFPKAAGGSGMDNPLLPSNIARDMHAVKKEADERWAKGDYPGAVAKYLESFIPILGPMMSHQGNELEQGKYAAFLGDALALTTNAAMPKLLENASASVPALAKNPNPTESAAVAFGQQRGVPVSAGVATNNRFIQGIQAGADRTPLGGLVERTARQSEASALQRVGGELADEVRQGAVTPEQAGSNAADLLTQKIQAHSQYADRAYDALRKIEANPKNARTVQTGTQIVNTGVMDPQGNPITRTVPTTETIQLPVDLRGAKASLKPIYDKLTRQYSVTQQQASAGYKALGNIVNGPDYAPLTQVETDLGAIKSIARGADMPELRTQSQGLAAEGVKQLDTAVQRTAASAGPEAVRALKNGRDATAAKYETADVLDRFRDEPVQVFRDAIAPADSAIDRLRSLAKQAPTAIPQLARAYLDDQLGKATAEGGFDKAARLQADWSKLGPQTKKILFPMPGQIEALDNYFRLAKRLAESPNPSGTALTAMSVASGGLIFTHPGVGIPLTLGSGALSKILRSPTAVQLLTKGLRLQLGPGRASQTAAMIGAADVIRAAQEAGALVPNPVQADQTPVGVRR